MTMRSTTSHFAWLGLEVLLAIIICFLILALAWSHNVTFDMTPTRDHTLSDQSQWQAVT